MDIRKHINERGEKINFIELILKDVIEIKKNRIIYN
jgi:hypothetical protein